MAQPAEPYLPNDDCADGASCPGEGVFLPQDLGNYELDRHFIGSDADVQANLGLADMDSYPLSDEVFPVIHDGALITLDGLIDCFARKYPERMDILNRLMENEGYQVVFEETPSAAEQELEAWLENYNRIIRNARRSAVTNEEYSEVTRMQNHYAQEADRLAAMRHWHIAPGRIYLSTRINRNIDINNYWLGDDEDEINPMPTNAEGADWLNEVMGDFMLRSGIPGATSDEEFIDNRNSRIAWGTMNVAFGAAEVIGGVALTLGTLGMGTVAGGALTIAGFEALTQGVDMWRTPEEASHAAGWLGDGAFWTAKEFGILEDDDQSAFYGYWAFGMLGLSLGGAGILGYAGKALPVSRIGLPSRLPGFVTETSTRAIASARQAIFAVKNARFGRFIISYASLPSGRIVMKIEGVGHIVVPNWESLTRLRARLNTITDVAAVQYRRAQAARLMGIFQRRRTPLGTDADAIQLVDWVYAHTGMPLHDKARYISRVSLAEPGRASSFNGAKEIKIARDIGRARNIGGTEFNPLVAMGEVFHELYHAQRFSDWVRSGRGTAAEYWGKYRQRSLAYDREEVRVEQAAQDWMRSMIEPRIALQKQYGNTRHLGDELQDFWDEYIRDSEVYIRRHGG